MGCGTAWKARDVDVVHGWLAAGKTTTAMATLRPDWPKSSIKKLVARLKAAGCTLASDPSERQGGRAQGRITHIASGVCCRCRKKLGTSSSTAWRVLHNTLKVSRKNQSKLSGSRLLPVSVAWRSVAVSASDLVLGSACARDPRCQL